jgi:DNA-binding MarR family transcriptional regulator
LTGRPATAKGARVGFLLRDVLRLLNADFMRRLSAAGLDLTPALYRTLFRLHREPGSRQVDLADGLEITPATLGRMLDRLEKQGLIRRVSHPQDRRAVRVFLDRRGVELMAQLESLARLTEERAFGGLERREREALSAALTRARANLTPGPAETRGGRRRGS